MLSVFCNSDHKELMVNTPKIDETSLKEDPFLRLTAQTLRTPDCIDLSFVPLINFNDISSNNQLTPSAVPSSDVKPYIQDNNNSVLLDLSPRIRNQPQMRPSFPHSLPTVATPVVNTNPYISDYYSNTSTVTPFTYQTLESHSYQTYGRVEPLGGRVEPLRERGEPSLRRTVTSTITRPEEVTSVSSTTFATTCEPSTFSESSRSLSGIDSRPNSYPSSENSQDKDRKYLNFRMRNNLASKKFRFSKRNKQLEMESKIVQYMEDNRNSRKLIDQMEREIAFYKSVLFKSFKKTNHANTSNS